MAAPKGNTYYKMAAKWTRTKKYTPKELLQKAVEYVEWCALNPLESEEVFGTGKRMKCKKLRAPTLQGFYLFSEISRDTFEEWSKLKEYSAISMRVRDLLFVTKFEGAAAGLLNASIIARELGLVDNQRQDINHSGKIDGPRQYICADEATKELIERLNRSDE